MACALSAPIRYRIAHLSDSICRDVQHHPLQKCPVCHDKRRQRPGLLQLECSIADQGEGKRVPHGKASLLRERLSADPRNANPLLGKLLKPLLEPERLGSTACGPWNVVPPPRWIDALSASKECVHLGVRYALFVQRFRAAFAQERAGQRC